MDQTPEQSSLTPVPLPPHSVQSTILKIFGLFLLGVIIIVLMIVSFIGIYKAKNLAIDKATLNQVSEVIPWVEGFYTINARYPTETEFRNKYPDFYKISSRGYSAIVPTKESPQQFVLTYDLIKERPNAPGIPFTFGMGFYEGYYTVTPCLRWSTLGLGLPKGFIGLNEGELRSDLDIGEIYLVRIINHEFANERIPVLTGLNKPRIFYQQETNKTIVTSGQDVISYNWNGITQKLENPQKIGEVPTDCPASELPR